MKINQRLKRMSLLVCFIPLFIACEQNRQDPVPDPIEEPVTKTPVTIPDPVLKHF